MNNRTRVGVPTFLDAEVFSEQVLEWLEDNAPLFEGLAFLRQLDDEIAAVQAVSETAEVTRLRVSWELWAALIEGEGGDAESALLPHLGAELLDWFRFALWGVALPASPELSLVQ